MDIKLVAIGSAHLDVIAKSLGDDRCIDQPGHTTIEVGGTACNISINWAKMGAQSNLVTAIDDGMLSKMIVDHVKKQGVDVHFESSPLLGAGVFSAHLNSSGDLVSAISHMPVEDHEFTTEFLDDVLDDADYVLLDCNLSEAELHNLSLECLARGIQFCIAAVSEEKGLRMQNVRSMPTLIAMNHKEAAFFLGHVIGDVPRDPIQKITALCDYMRAPCIMTLGAQGAIYKEPDGEPIFEKPEQVQEDGNRLGAGDGFLAAFVLAVAMGASPNSAIKRATRVASLIASKSVANLGQAHPLEDAFEDLSAKAFKDPLTGLTNRAGAKAGLDQRKRNDSTFPLGVLLFDVDFFKRINDQLGHDQGDVALQNVSLVLQQTLRSQDIASRWGGEEFIAFIPNSNESELRLVAERLRKAIESARIIADWTVTVSIGIALAKEETSLEESIKNADKALYFAKKNGRNQVAYWDPKIDLNQNNEENKESFEDIVDQKNEEDEGKSTGSEGMDDIDDILNGIDID